MKALNRIEMTLHDGGRVVWCLVVGDKREQYGFERNDPNGERARAAARECAQAVAPAAADRARSASGSAPPPGSWLNNHGVPFGEAVFKAANPSSREPGEWVNTEDEGSFNVMMEQLKRGAVVEVSRLHLRLEGAPPELFAANMLAHRRPVGSSSPPLIVGATVDASRASALLEAGARWLDSGPSPLSRARDATYEELLAEVEAGGCVELRDVVCVRADENRETVRERLRGAYRFTREGEAAKSSPMYGRVTVEQARTLLQKGATWGGDGDRDPRRSDNSD